MNPDDESYLSAYLDDELAPADRLSVELALEADPALRDRLHGLTRVRDAFSGLSRPTIPVDLTSSVLSRLPSVLTGVRSTRLYRTSLWVATAATVLFAIGFTFRDEFAPKPQGPGRPPAAVAISSGLDQHPVEVENPALLTSLNPPSTATLVPNPNVGRPAPLIEKKPSSELSGESPADRDRLLALLDSPNLRRVMIPIDVVGGDPTSKINRIVQDSPRQDADYFRMTLMQGLVIDPALPNKAELYVLVVTEVERDQLVKSLSKSFGGVTEGNFPGSEVPALLADAGEVKVFPGRPAAGLVEPPPRSIDAFATKIKTDPALEESGQTTERPDSNPNSTGKIVVTKQRQPKGEAGVSISPKAKGTSRALSSDVKITLVLWVTKREPAN